MKKRFTEEPIIGFLLEAEPGLPVAELCRRYGFSEASDYLWRSKFGALTALRTVRMSTFAKKGDAPSVEGHRRPIHIGHHPS